MLFLKEGAQIKGTVYTNAILRAVQVVYSRHGWDVTVTSGNDSQHGRNSQHPLDRAIDVRFWCVPQDDRQMIAQELREALSPFYDVVLEPTHYHIEADSKKEQEALRVIR